MNSELIKRLRDRKFWYTPHNSTKDRPLRHDVAVLAANEIERLEAELFAANLSSKTFEEGYDEATAARRYLEHKIERLEANESSTISLLESLETTLCTGEYNDRVANALSLLSEILARAALDGEDNE